LAKKGLLLKLKLVAKQQMAGQGRWRLLSEHGVPTAAKFPNAEITQARTMPRVRIGPAQPDRTTLDAEIQPAIVDRDLFEAVQAKLSEQLNNHRTTRTKSEALSDRSSVSPGSQRDHRSHRDIAKSSRSQGRLPIKVYVEPAHLAHNATFAQIGHEPVHAAKPEIAPKDLRSSPLNAVIDDASGEQGLGLRPSGPMIVELFTKLGLGHCL
jgi:hypothetical protein